MSARKSSHRAIVLIVSSGSPLALIASSLRSTSKKPVCPMTRSLHPPMAHCRQRVRFATTWPEEFFEVPTNKSKPCLEGTFQECQQCHSPSLALFPLKGLGSDLPQSALAAYQFGRNGSGLVA